MALCASPKFPPNALFGLVVWASAVTILQPGWAPSLLLLAPLVAVPLALFVLSLTSALRWLCFVAALPLVPAYACERGVVAAAFTAPWLLACGGWALTEVVRFPRRGDLPRVLVSGYLTVGAGWLTLARFGARPLGFEDVIVHATAMHFHYAGFVLPVLVMRLLQVDQHRATRWALWGVLAGMPLVAAGITFTVWGMHELETAATLFMAGACWLAAWRQLRIALTISGIGPRLLLIASSAALSVAMVLACGYALGQLLGTPWLDIPFMLQFHGGLQVFAFALPALVAWQMRD